MQIDNSRVTHVIVDPFALRARISSDIGCKKSHVWVERKSLSSLSVVLPVIIIQARFSRGRSVRSYGTRRGFLRAAIMRDRVQRLFIG